MVLLCTCYLRLVYCFGYQRPTQGHLRTGSQHRHGKKRLEYYYVFAISPPDPTWTSPWPFFLFQVLDLGNRISVTRSRPPVDRPSRSSWSVESSSILSRVGARSCFCQLAATANIVENKHIHINNPVGLTQIAFI